MGDGECAAKSDVWKFVIGAISARSLGELDAASDCSSVEACQTTAELTADEKGEQYDKFDEDSEELAGTGPEAPWLPRRLAREVIAPAAHGKDRWFHQTTHLLFLLRATWTPVNPSAGAVGGRQVDAAAALVQDRRGQTTPLLLLTILLLRATWTPTATALVPGNPSAVTVGGGTPSGARCCGRGCATRRPKSGRSSAASARAPSPRAAT